MKHQTGKIPLRTASRPFRAAIAGLCTLALLILGASAQTAHAQQLSKGKISSAEDVAFAFYKLSGTKPDLEHWAQKSQIPGDISVAEYPAYKRAKLRRLQSQYQSYNPENTLKILINAKISLRPAQKWKTSGVGAKNRPGVEIDLGMQDTPYFPYQVADQWISVIIKDIDKVLSFDLTNEDQAKISSGFHLSGNMSRSVTLVMTVKPLSADAKAPLRLNGIDQWLLMGELVSASFWNNQGELVWEIQDKNYVSPQQKEIEKLFRE